MNAAEIIIVVYLLLGVIYTGYLFTQRSVSLLSIPLNILGGPLTVLYFVLKLVIKKDTNPAKIRNKDVLKDKKAAFFDLDGTIWDSDPLWVKAIEQVAKDNGFGDINILSTYLPGTRLIKTWKVLQAYNDFEMPKKKNFNVLAKETEIKMIETIKSAETIELTEGFTELAFFLKEERGLKLALVTNSSRDVTEAFLEKTEIGYMFDLVLTGNDVHRHKPSPDIFFKAARKLHISTKKALVFEDSLSGSKAASRAGMDQVIIWRTSIPQVEYYGNIFGFYPDFEGLDKILDVPAQQRVLQGIEMLRKAKGMESQQETQNPNETEVNQ